MSKKPSGYFLFVTPSSTKDSIFFPSNDEDYEDLFKKKLASSDNDDLPKNGPPKA